ncbi:hypothetical protein Tco_1323388 [Tanacetum coccineum]
MSFSHIFVSSDSMDESIRSSASYVILTDSETTPVWVEAVVAAPPTGALDLAPVSDTESKPFEDPPSPVTESEPFEDPPSPVNAPDRTRRSPSSSSSSSSPSSSLGYLASALSSPPSGPSRRRSCSSSPSSDSSQPSSAPPPRKRCRVSSDSSPSSASPLPSPSAGPFHKRFRSPTPPASTAITPTPVVVSLLPTDLLPPHKRFRGTPSAPQEDAPVEATTEARLTHHTRLINEIHYHLREISIARERVLELQFQVKDTVERLQQGEITQIGDRV